MSTPAEVCWRCGGFVEPDEDFVIGGDGYVICAACDDETAGCDRCGEPVADGHGHYDAGDRVCASCAEEQA